MSTDELTVLRIAVVPCAVVDFAEMDYLMRGDGSVSAVPANLQRMQVAHLPCCPNLSSES